MAVLLLFALFLPIALVPTLVYTDAALGDWTTRNQARASATADWALGTAMQKVIATPTFTGTVKQTVATNPPDGTFWCYSITGTGSTREIIALGYMSQGAVGFTRGPLAVRRIHATIESTDGMTGPRWRYRSRQIVQGARVFQVFPINRSTGATGSGPIGG